MIAEEEVLSLSDNKLQLISQSNSVIEAVPLSIKMAQNLSDESDAMLSDVDNIDYSDRKDQTCLVGPHYTLHQAAQDQDLMFLNGQLPMQEPALAQPRHEQNLQDFESSDPVIDDSPRNTKKRKQKHKTDEENQTISSHKRKRPRMMLQKCQERTSNNSLPSPEPIQAQINMIQDFKLQNIQSKEPYSQNLSEVPQQSQQSQQQLESKSLIQNQNDEIEEIIKELDCESETQVAEMIETITLEESEQQELVTDSDEEQQREQQREEVQAQGDQQLQVTQLFNQGSRKIEKLNQAQHWQDKMKHRIQKVESTLSKLKKNLGNDLNIRKKLIIHKMNSQLCNMRQDVGSQFKKQDSFSDTDSQNDQVSQSQSESISQQDPSCVESQSPECRPNELAKADQESDASMESVRLINQFAPAEKQPVTIPSHRDSGEQALERTIVSSAKDESQNDSMESMPSERELSSQKSSVLDESMQTDQHDVQEENKASDLQAPSQEESKNQPKPSQDKFQKKLTNQEKKLFDKRKKTLQQAPHISSQITSFDWESLLGPNQKAATSHQHSSARPNAFSNFNLSTYWYWISRYYFPKELRNEVNRDPESYFNGIRSMHQLAKPQQWDKVLKVRRLTHRKSYTIRQRFADVLQASNSDAKGDEHKSIDRIIDAIQNELENTQMEIDTQAYFMLEKVKEEASQESSYSETINQLVCEPSRLDMQDENFVVNSSLANELNFQEELAEKYFSMEEERFHQQQLQLHRKQSDDQMQVDDKNYTCLRSTNQDCLKTHLNVSKIAYDQCSICCSDEYDTDNVRLQCALCEAFVHQECVGEEARTLKYEADSTGTLFINWVCQACQVYKYLLEEKDYEIEPIFKPNCVFCGLPDGIMRATTAVQKDIKDTPGCNKSSWNANSTIGITLSGIYRKERDYQVKLMEMLAKDQPIDKYVPTFVHWSHMSCSFWLPQIQYQRKKPVQYRIPYGQPTETYPPCEICGSDFGMMFRCSHESKIKSSGRMDSAAARFLEDLQDSLNANSEDRVRCDKYLHVECARRADYFMEYNPQSETHEMYCAGHRPFPLTRRLKSSFWEQVDQVSQFTETYPDCLKKANENEQWSEKDKKTLLDKVSKAFLKLPQMILTLTTYGNNLRLLPNYKEKGFYNDPELKMNPLPGDVDFMVTFSRDKFPWKSIAFKDYSAHDCWSMYWQLISPFESIFKLKVVGANRADLILYNKIEKMVKAAKVSQHKKWQKFEEQRQERLRKEQLQKQKLQKRQAKLDAKYKEDQQKIKERAVRQQLLEKRKQKELKMLQLKKIQQAKQKDKLRRLKLRDKKRAIEEQRALQKAARSLKMKKSRQQELNAKMKEKEQTLTCYCKCTMLDIEYEKRKNIQMTKLNSDQPDEPIEDLEKKIRTSDHSEQAKLEADFLKKVSVPGNRSSKSGIIRCSKKTECNMGSYFHIICCYKNDQTFDVRSKSRSKWFCLDCRERQKRGEFDSALVSSKVSSRAPSRLRSRSASASKDASAAPSDVESESATSAVQMKSLLGKRTKETPPSQEIVKKQKTDSKAIKKATTVIKSKSKKRNQKKEVKQEEVPQPSQLFSNPLPVQNLQNLLSRSMMPTPRTELDDYQQNLLKQYLQPTQTSLSQQNATQLLAFHIHNQLKQLHDQLGAQIQQKQQQKELQQQLQQQVQFQQLQQSQQVLQQNMLRSMISAGPASGQLASPLPQRQFSGLSAFTQVQQPEPVKMSRRQSSHESASPSTPVNTDKKNEDTESSSQQKFVIRIAR